MKKKTFYSAILLTIVLFFVSSCTFATDNSMTQGIQNTMQNAGNTLQGAMQNVGNTVRDAGNAVGESANKTMQSAENAINGMTNSMDNMTGTTEYNGNYNSVRTATGGTDTTSMFGMTSDTWTWIIVALSVVGIGTLIYSYIAQKNSRYYDDVDE